jgi:HlyD family secretion protein
MFRRASTPSHEIAPWISKTDAVLARRGRSFGSPAVWTLVAMVAVLFGITPFVDIDRVVTSTSGKVVATEALITYQALDPSIIKTIAVREGETVRAGQLLATLDPTFAAADVDQLRQQLAGLDAQIQRAEAEQDGKTYRAAPADAAKSPYVALQASLFGERAAQLDAQLRSFDEKIKTSQASIARIEADQGHITEREKISRQIEGMRDTLYKSGSTSLLNLLQASDSHVEMLRTLENNRHSLDELRHQVSALQSDRQNAVQQWYATSSQELVTARNQRDVTRASLDKALKHQDLVSVVAKEPAVVLTLTKLSAGSVLKEGDPVVTLVPLGAPIEAEIHFSAADIGFVRPGNPVTVKVDAFSYVEHGTAAGHLDWISEGSFTADDNGKPVDPFYKARVTIDRMDFINVPSGFRLIPGMTLAADINVGQRSLYRFVVGTLTHGLGEALREP